MRVFVFLTTLPGVLWGLLLLAVTLKGQEGTFSEGTFLLQATALLTVLALIMNVFEKAIPAGLYWSTFLTSISAALVASAVFLPVGTYVTILQPLIVACCWIFVSSRAHVALRWVSLVVAVVFASIISAMVLAIWGMGAAAKVLNG